MAKLAICSSLIEERLFGFADKPVSIVGCHWDPVWSRVVFDVAGSDIPDCEEITATIERTQNRAGERLHHMTFQALTPAPKEKVRA